VLIGEIAAAVVVIALTVTLLTRRVAHDDVHSVEGYHRSLHTLESIKAHPALPQEAVESSPAMKPAYPESAVRLAGTSSVRVSGRHPPPVPPVALPSTVDPEGPVTFEDAGPPSIAMAPPGSGQRDKAMVSINHRPRRLAAPAMALAAVSVLIVVLVVTGSHSVAPPHHHKAGSAKGRSNSSGPKPAPKHTATTTPTTQPPPAPAVSAPQQSTSRNATYDVASSDFTLDLSATSGACWVDVTNSTSGATYFEGTLEPGEPHVLNVSSPLTVVVGAPTLFGASVNGVAAALPLGFQTPFTMNFVSP
jgi:Domain of unknown function (DUF4115)